MKMWFPALLLLCLVAGSQSSFAIPDPGTPDTMLVTGGPLIVGKSVPLNFTLKNDELLNGLLAPIRVFSIDGGFARLDSVVYVNRLADPTVLDFRIYTPKINGASPDSIAFWLLKATGEPLPIGNTSIVNMYFTGVSQGRMTAMHWLARSGEGPSIVLPGNSYVVPITLLPTSFDIIVQPDPPFITLPNPITRAVAGSTIEIPLNYGSLQGYETALSIESVSNVDDEARLPSGIPTIVDGDSPKIEWQSSAADVGIWKVVLKVTDSQNLSSNATVEIQLVENDNQLVGFETVVTDDDVNSTTLATGNFDNDPEFELFSTGGATEPGPGAAILEFSSSGLDRVYEHALGIHKFGARLGYVNGDNKLDVVLTSWGTGPTSYRDLQCYLGDGLDGFKIKQTNLAYGLARGATLGEFTGDGFIDYAYVTGNQLIVFPSIGDGTFSSPTVISVPEIGLSLNCADFNSDGRDDFAIGTRQNVKIYLRRPVGDLRLAATYPQDYGTVDIDITNSGSDFNSDGKFDLCMASPSVGGARSKMMIYFGNGDGTFDQTEIRDINGQILATCVADFNGDTKLDIAFVNGASRYVGIIFGDGAGNFASELRYPIATLRPRLIDCVDYDRDGDPDIVVAASGNSSENAFFLLTNESDPAGYSAGQFEVTAQNNAQITIVSPGGGQLSEICNSIPAASMYKRDVDGNETLDSYASLGVVESGEYIVKVAPKPNLPANSPFSLEYSIGGQNFRLARDCAMRPAGFEFGVPLEADAVAPRPGSFVGATISAFKWQGSGQFEFQLASDIAFQNILLSQSVSGNTLPYSSSLGYSDTTSYFWRVKPSGSGEYGKIYSFNVVSAATDAESESPILPLTYSLEQNYPNPFNPTTRIKFTLARSGYATVRITNILGETVATLLDDYIAAGDHTLEWQGTNQTGRPVPSGVYFYSLKAGDYSNVRKMVLLK